MRIVWYPDDLFWMDGGWQGLQIIAPVDLVLGPALTLIFYRPWKKKLKFDMTAIAAVQIAALSYGVFLAYNQRPAAIVFAENRFETLSVAAYKEASELMIENDMEPKSLRDFGTKMPIVVYAEPFVGDEFGDYLADTLNGLPELRERSDRFMPISDSFSEIAKYRISSQQDGTSIAGSEDGKIVEVTASSQGSGSKEDATVAISPEIYTLKARYADGTIEFDPGNFDWLRITRDSASN